MYCSLHKHCQNSLPYILSSKSDRDSKPLAGIAKPTRFNHPSAGNLTATGGKRCCGRGPSKNSLCPASHLKQKTRRAAGSAKTQFTLGLLSSKIEHEPRTRRDEGYALTDVTVAEQRPTCTDLPLPCDGYLIDWRILASFSC